ncbi:iron-regulated Lsr2 protein [Mycobacteroides abscessus subsp. abscessus]|nr:iron-regulated Lsr2 protein [Mycobacteroides abscessus subsp. abscessus]
MADETVSFALDGVHYELDLCTANAEQLRALFAQWTPFARRVGKAAGGTRAPRSRRATEQDQTLAIRPRAGLGRGGGGLPQGEPARLNRFPRRVVDNFPNLYTRCENAF